MENGIYSLKIKLITKDNSYIRFGIIPYLDKKELDSELGKNKLASGYFYCILLIPPSSSTPTPSPRLHQILALGRDP